MCLSQWHWREVVRGISDVGGGCGRSAELLAVRVATTARACGIGGVANCARPAVRFKEACVLCNRKNAVLRLFNCRRYIRPNQSGPVSRRLLQLRRGSL